MTKNTSESPSKREALIDSLHQRALAGDNDAARIVLEQTHKIVLKESGNDDDGAFSARGAYLGLWQSLTSGQINISEAKDLLEILGKVDRFIG